MAIECTRPGCEAHPSKGDTLIRVNEKGVPAKMLCADHYREVEEFDPDWFGKALLDELAHEQEAP